MMSPKKNLKSISIISLGCPKNLVDSETFLGSFALAGFQITTAPEDADAVIINTCGFIQPAEEESLQVISELLALKGQARPRIVVVAGCLGEKMSLALEQRFPEIDYITGVLNQENIVKVFNYLNQAFYGGKFVRERHISEFVRLPLTPRHYAYLRIAEGCDNRCSYCLIPSFRGAFRSKPFEQLIDEAKFFADNGCKELNLIAQDTTNYGKDLYGKKRLPELLSQLSKIESIRWIRILYTHPAHYDDELILEISQNPRIVKYLDLPLQHISDKILKSMERKVTKDDVVKLIEKLRSRIKGLFLRTSFIVGFPGETESDFEEIVDFIHYARFERAGVFTYSHEIGTKAYDFEHQVPEEVKRQRRARIMSAQQKIAFEINESMVGREIDVLVELETQEPGAFIGRFYGDAPVIDNVVFLQGKNLQIGEIYHAVITGSSDYDLNAKAENV